MIERILYVFSHGEMKNFGKCIINDDNYAFTKGNPEGIPIEDFGDYLLTEKEVSPDEAFDIFMEKIS